MLKQLNERPFQKLPGSRASAFATLDVTAIQTVPARRYEIATFKTVKVHIDYHVAVEKHRYSVPHALVGETLEAHITRTAIELLRRVQRIACHARKSRVRGFSTVVGQMPAAHRAYMEWTPQRMIDWGARSAPQRRCAYTAAGGKQASRARLRHLPRPSPAGQAQWQGPPGGGLRAGLVDRCLPVPRRQRHPGQQP